MAEINEDKYFGNLPGPPTLPGILLTVLMNDIILISPKKIKAHHCHKEGDEAFHELTLPGSLPAFCESTKSNMLLEAAFFNASIVANSGIQHPHRIPTGDL